MEDAVGLVEYSPRLGEVPVELVEGSTKSVEPSLSLVELARTGEIGRARRGEWVTGCPGGVV